MLATPARSRRPLCSAPPWVALGRVLIGLVLCAQLAHAQLSKPPRRSKDDCHKTSAPQEPLVDIMAWAWVDRLEPYITSIDRKEMHRRLSNPLKNQYSDHAVWNFHQELIRLLKDDLGISDARFAKADRKWLEGGEGVEVSLADQVAALAAQSSNGVLGYGKWLGKKRSVEACHDRLMNYDQKTIDDLSKLRRVELDLPRRSALQKLATAAWREFDQHAPAGTLKVRKRFRPLLEEALMSSDTQAAMTSVRSKLVRVLRSMPEYKRPELSIQETIAFADELRSQVEAVMPRGFWEQLERYHRGLLEAPQTWLETLESQGFAAQESASPSAAESGDERPSEKPEGKQPKDKKRRDKV